MGYQVNEKGFYGEFGGAYIPEMMHPNIEELKNNYLRIINSYNFRQDFIGLLKNYVGRPSPLYYAKRMSEHYQSHIYLKREDCNHTGSHKINNTIGQILLAKELGKTRIIAETGAGQHGLATATVCALMNMNCIVYMGAVDVERQAPNVKKMRMLGAEVIPVHSGNKTLKDATNEAMRDWINNPVDTHYIIGSVVGPHPYPDMVARFQAVISEEIRWQLDEQTGREKPTRVMACVGGGSNAAGAFYHFLDDEDVELIGWKRPEKAWIRTKQPLLWRWERRVCCTVRARTSCKTKMARLPSHIPFLQAWIIPELAPCTRICLKPVAPNTFGQPTKKCCKPFYC